MTKIKKQFEYKIGADPEFVLTMQGKKVDAKQTMELMLSNKKDLENIESGYKLKEYGNIGWDGASSTGEVRPSAALDPRQVVGNLAALFKEFAKHIQICDMSTISEFSSVGGHIHLEIPKGEKWTNEKKNLMHRRLASFYLPLLMAENKTNLNIRIKQNYGSIKDHRIESKFRYDDGTPGYTLEFRCPSAEWLTTPKIAGATLAYFSVVYHEIMKHPKSFSKINDIVYKNDKIGDALQTLALMEYDALTQGILNKARKYIRTFEMYDVYKDEIEYIFNTKQVIKDKQNANFNIAKGWKLIEETTPKKSELMSSENKIKKIAEVKDFDTLKKVMNIQYNDDTNVGLFAENLKDRVAAFNWKLKNNYYIFGMRKGIEEITVRNANNTFITGEKQIETVYDDRTLRLLFDKMEQKFGSSGSDRFPRGTTIDFITGKTKDLGETTLLIGLPYSMRINKNIKPFIQLIWAIENNEIKKEKPKELRNDMEDELETRGLIYKILTKQTGTQEQSVVMDQNSQSLRNSACALNEMLNETINN